MSVWRRFVVAAAAGAVVVGAAVEVASAARAGNALPRYSIIDLTPNAQFGSASAINDAGEVVGNTFSPGDAQTHPFVWSRGVVRAVPTPSGFDLGGFATDVNDAGAIVGYASSGNGPEGFLAVHGDVYGLSELLVAAAINNSGRIAGAVIVDGRQHSALDDHGAVQDLGTLFARGISYPADINNAGSIVGTEDSNVGFQSPRHAFLFNKGKLSDLGTLGGDSSSARAISARGDVVGYSSTGSADHAFLYRDGVMRDLGTLPSAGPTFSDAFGLNANGDIVGASCPCSTTSAAVLWSHGKIENLNDLIAPGSGWILAYASAINGRGEIVGAGLLNGEQHAFLLEPRT